MSLYVEPVTTPVDAQGDPYPGAKLYFYAAGTLTPSTVYADAARTTALSHPVVANASGQFVPIYIDPAIAYRRILRDASDVLLRDNDNITAASLTAASVGAALYAQSASEISASVTPTLYQYPVGDIRRYGAVGDNSTECATAITNAVIVQAVSGGTVYIPPGRYRTTAAVPLLAKVNVRGDGYASVIEANGCDAFTFGFTTGFGKVVLEDFAIVGTTCETKKGIYQAGTLDDADELYGITLSRLLITDFNCCVKLRNARVVTIDNCWLQDTNQGIDLTGKCLVVNITGNEVVYAAGCGTGTKFGLNLDLFDFSSGTGNVGTEGLQVYRNQFFGFEYGILASYCFYANLVGNDIQATIRGIDFETMQYVLNIKDNFIEMITTNATQGIFGRGLSSTLTTQVNIEGNAIGGSGTLGTCSGIQLNEAGNSNQNNVSIVRNRIKQMTAFDIIVYNGGRTNIEDNNCESTAPTYSIRVDAVALGPVFIDKNKCFKDIYFDPAEAASGEVIVGTNTKSGTTLQVGAQICPVVASATALTLPLGADVFEISGTTNITSIVATGWTGRTVRLIFQDVLTLTDGSNLKLAGNFVSSADDGIQLCCNGTNWFTVGGPSAN